MSYTFLSYSRGDQAFAARLAQDLRAHGVHVWFDQFDIKPGTQWDQEVERGLRGSSGMLLVLSQRSAESPNVLNELSWAIETKRYVIPIIIGPTQIPLQAIRLNRVDFTGNYAQALGRLVAFMTGVESRTQALSQIAAPMTGGLPPPVHYPSGPQPAHFSSGSMQPMQLPVQPSVTRSNWAVPLLLGIGVGVTLLIFGMVVLVKAFGDQSSNATVAGATDGQAPAATSNALAALRGSWVSTCSKQAASDAFFQLDSVSYDSSSYVHEVTYCLTADCSEPLFASRISANVSELTARSSGIFEIDYFVTSVTLVPIIAAAKLNESGMFGFHDWQDGIPKDLSDHATESGISTKSGDTIYDLVSAQGNKYFRGLITTNIVPHSVSERPSTLDTGRVFFRR